MQAYQIVEWGRPAEFVDVPVPLPEAGEVLVRMKGAGLCRSDLDIIDAVPGSQPYAAAVPAGFTLGHENAGVVEMVGAGVSDLRVGDGVVVHHMHSCGNCEFCHEGFEQSCRTYARGAIGLTRGVGLDGGLAPFLVVPRRELIALGALDPRGQQGTTPWLELPMQADNQFERRGGQDLRVFGLDRTRDLHACGQMKCGAH